MPATTAPADGGARRGAPAVGRALSALLLALLATLGICWGLLTASGGHLFVVQTPSMARTAPVGSLVVTEKVDPGTLAKGDIITFRPPSNPRVYTHRIVEVTDAGFRTKGDLNGAPDGWVVPRQNVIGKAAHLWFGLGYLLRMTPWLALGGFLTAAVAWRTRRPHRPAVVIMGASLAVSLALVVVRPLVGAVTTGFVPVGTDSVKMSAVGTGVLPIRVTSLDDRYADLVAGRLGWVTTAKTDGHGRYQLLPTLHLPWWGWVLMALVCALPFLASLLVRTPEDDAPGVSGTGPGAGGAITGASRRRIRRRLSGRRATAVLSSIAVTVATGIALSPTSAALTARVTNTTDTARTRTYFTCLDAMRAFNTTTGNGQLYTGWTVGDGTGVSGTTDQSTTNNGPYSLLPVSTTALVPTVRTDVGCQSDFTARHQGALTLNGTTSQLNVVAGSSVSQITNDPGDVDDMTWTMWFRTRTTSGGVLACPGDSGDFCADYTTWMNTDGTVSFGVGTHRITSAKAYNDGAWHFVAAQSDSSTGLKLWLDGALVASDPATSWGANGYIGYPQFGFSAKKSQTSPLTAHPPASYYFAGDIQFVAIYGRGSSSNKQVGQAEITNLYESALP